MTSLSTTDNFQFGRFHLDRRGLFRRDGGAGLAPVEVGSRALDVLRVLVERPGDLVSRDEIMAVAWPGIVVEDNNLTIQIAALRHVLDQDRANGSCIQTVTRRGYRFVAQVARAEPEGSSEPGSPPGNSIDGPVTEREQAQAVGTRGKTVRAALALSNARYRLWAGALATAIGALILTASLGTWRVPWLWNPPPAPHLSIVVLPFANLSNDPEQQYFADGITEDLTTDLSRIADLLVISRNTAFTYQGKRVDTKQIGRELSVRYVLEGSVRRSDGRVRVSAQLVDAETDAHLWADRLDGDTGGLFTLQDEITSRIANTLGVELIAAEADRQIDNPDALDYILRGRAAQLKPNSRDVYAETISWYERALAVDPQSAEAMSLLANAVVSRVGDLMTDTAAADIARAEELVDQVLAAEPRNGYAHYVKGKVLFTQRRLEEAILELETSLALRPNSVWPLHYLATCKWAIGSIEEVIPLERQAIRLSPREPRIGWWYLRIGQVHLLQSRIDEAIVWLEKARNNIPAAAGVRIFLASAYALRGETERASTELAEARRLNSDDRFSSIAHVRAAGTYEEPKMRALCEATYFAGLRKAGMPEE